MVRVWPGVAAMLAWVVKVVNIVSQTRFEVYGTCKDR